jgi:hypothetical protein
MPYTIAGIDVHKKMLAVVVSDVELDNEYQFERRKFGSNPEQLRLLVICPTNNLTTRDKYATVGYAGSGSTPTAQRQ